MIKIYRLVPLAAALVLAGCINLAPDYERPEAPVAQAWPEGESYKLSEVKREALPEWRDFICDEKLRRVIELALANNRDLRMAAYVVKKLGRKIAPTIVQALVVPGSGLVKQQAESEGLDKIFTAAGFEWREPGCSMCLAMNADRIGPGDRCASTSNRNFEGRQGKGGRTHLVSPAMAAAAAVEGHFVDVRKLF